MAFWFSGSAGDIGLEADESKYIPAAMVAETLGTVLLTFLYLIQTEPKTRLSQDPAICTFIIAATYLAAILMVGAPDNSKHGVLNPAIGTCTSFVMVFQGGNSAGIKYFWIYLAFPFLGSFLGVLFHEMIYKKVQDNIEETEHHDDGDGLLDGGDAGEKIEDDN